MITRRIKLWVRLLISILLLSTATKVSAVIVEGDIYTADNNVASQYSTLPTSTWTSGYIPFVIDKSLFSDRDALINLSNAMQYIRGNTSDCVRFHPRLAGDVDYINITSANDGCYSSVGRQGGGQIVNIGPTCTTVGIIIHELMHALGFWHEQSRTDRDNFVTILWNHVMLGSRDEFKIHTETADVAKNVPYDFYSILHYKRNEFSIIKDLDTIVPKDNYHVSKNVLGQRVGLSPKDTQKIIWLYQCKESYCMPPDIENLREDPPKYRYSAGDTVSLYCTNGPLIGPRSSTCLPDRLWSGATPLCIGKDQYIYCDMSEGCLKEWGTRYSWQPKTGSSVTLGNGPLMDNTYNNISGTYLTAEITTRTAIVRTPPVRVTSEQTALMFYYYIYGPNLGSSRLSVYTDGSKTPVWTKNRSEPEPRWYRAVIKLGNIADYTRIYFVAETSTMGPQSSIAIDDVLVAPASVIDRYIQATADSGDVITKPIENDFFK